MSFTMMAKAKPIQTGNAGRKLVLMMLADIADDHGQCFPSYQHLADVCEMSKRSVMRHISDLEGQGFVIIEHRKGVKQNKSNVYTLDFSSDTQTLPSDTVSPPSSDKLSPITYHSSEPIKEPIKKVNKKSSLCLSDLPDHINFQLMADYIDMRNSIKSPMTQRALTILINEVSRLETLGHDPTALLEAAILNNWKSVYPPRGTLNHANANNQPVNNSAPARVRAVNAARQAQRERAERETNRAPLGGNV